MKRRNLISGRKGCEYVGYSLFLLFILSLVSFTSVSQRTIRIDLNEVVHKKEGDSARTSSVSIARSHLNDSILIRSPLLGTSTCLAISQNEVSKTEEFKDRIRNNCAFSSTIDFTQVPDGTYTFSYVSCWQTALINIELSTQAEH